MKKTLCVCALVSSLLCCLKSNAGDFYPAAAPSPSYAPSNDQGKLRTGYIFGYGGLAFSPDLSSTQPDTGMVFDFEYDDGHIFGGGAGMYSDFLGGSRFEIEGFTSSTGDLMNVALEGISAPSGVFGGDLGVSGVMFNIIKEFDNGGMLVPYLGAGIGYGSASFDFHRLDGTFSSSVSQGVPIYQAILGMDFRLSDSVSIFTQYKLMGIGETDWSIVGINWNNESYINHSVSAGLRISF